MIPMTDLTDNQRYILMFMANKMEATAVMAGEFVFRREEKATGLRRVGSAGVCGGRNCAILRKLGLLTFLPDLKAYRITNVGRQWLKDFGVPHTQGGLPIDTVMT